MQYLLEEGEDEADWSPPSVLPGFWGAPCCQATRRVCRRVLAQLNQPRVNYTLWEGERSA